MENKIKYILIAIVAIGLIVAGVVVYNMLTDPNIQDIDNPISTGEGQNSNSTGKIQIIVDSNTSFRGSIDVYTFSNVQANENGSYRMSQFFRTISGSKDPSGRPHEIKIIDGKATFDIPEGTQFFIVDQFGDTDNEFGHNSNNLVTVSLYSNGAIIKQSTNPIVVEEFKIDFGYLIFDSNAKVLSGSNLINDMSSRST